MSEDHQSDDGAGSDKEGSDGDSSSGNGQSQEDREAAQAAAQERFFELNVEMSALNCSIVSLAMCVVRILRQTFDRQQTRTHI